MTSPELLLISAILRTQDHITAQANGITPDMFHGYRDEYEWIDKCIQNRNRTPSRGSFREAFPDVPLKAVDDVEMYCEAVAQNHSQQVLISGMHRVTQALRRGDTGTAVREWTSVSADAQASLFGSSFDGDIFREFEDIEEEILARKKRMEETGFAGIPTGFPTLDELTGGIQPGWFVVVMARGGIGKTRSLIRMACAAAFSGFTTQYDALEQSRAEIAMQVHAFASSEFGQSVFKSLDLAQGKNYDVKSYRNFLRKLSSEVKGKMHVADNRRGRIGGPTIMAQIKKNQPDVCFLDYLTLIEGAEDWQSTANLSTQIAQTAKQTGCAIVTAAQVNRNGAGTREQGLEHLAATDRLGQDADLVISVQQFSRSVLVMSVVKFRHGPTGWKLYLKFDPNMGVMEEITYEDAVDIRDQDDDRKDEKSATKKFVPRKKGSFAATAPTVQARKKALSANGVVRKYQRAER